MYTTVFQTKKTSILNYLWYNICVTEADRTTLFLKFAKARIRESFAFEAKICKEKSLPFSAVKEHQERNLYQVKHSVFNYKISDVGYDQKPWDGFQLLNQNAYVVIFWYQHRGDRRMTMIDIDTWMAEKEQSDRKSLTFERAIQVGKLYNL